VDDSEHPAPAMRIAIVSDTHMPRGERRIPPSCLDRCREADAILHAGDLADVPVLELLNALGPPVHAIHGNVDTAAIRALLPARVELALGGARIGMIHAPGPAAGRLPRLRAAFPDCQAVVFGHTHMPEHGERDGFQIFNPGSPTERRRAPLHTMGMARIEDGAITFELVVV
jgi:putative phosphoesterase